MKKEYIVKLLTVFFFIVFIFYFYSNKHDFVNLLQIQWYYIVSIIILKMIILFINGLYISVFLKGYKLSMSHVESYFLSFITTWGNYFGPFQGGSGLRALYLKKKYKFPISLFLATMYGNYVLVFFVNGIISLFALTLIYLNTGLTNHVILIFFSAIVLITSIIIYVPQSSHLIKKILINANYTILTKLTKIFEGWIKLRNNHILIQQLILLTISNFILWLLMYYIEFRSIGVDLSLNQSLIFTSITSSTILVNITPGGIGIRESFQLLFSNFIGISEIDIVSVAILDRGLLFISLVLLYLFFLKTRKETKW